MEEDLIRRSIDLPGGAVELCQPREFADLPDSGGVEWAPIAPYWSVLWRSGLALAGELDGIELSGLRVVELGCGLAVPSIVAARRGATVLATDGDPEGLELVDRNAALNAVSLETAALEWESPPEDLLARAPFDLVLAADLLYERDAVGPLAALLPRLAPQAWLADPGRPAAASLLEGVCPDGPAETRRRGVVSLYRLQLG